MWPVHGVDGWIWLVFAMLASMLVLAAGALWLLEILAGWPWRDRDRPIHDEIERLEHRHDRGRAP